MLRLRKIIAIVGLVILSLPLTASSVSLCGSSPADILEYSDQPLSLSGPRWTSDGAHIIFAYGHEIYVVDLDGSRLLSILGSGSGYDLVGSPDVSADGSRIAYVAFEHTSGWPLSRRSYGWEITISDVDGSDRRRLTCNDCSNDYPTWSDGNDYPVWSPDAKRIAFVGGAAIQTIAADGSDVRVLWTGHVIGPPSWSPDGSRLAFTALVPVEGEDVRTIHTIGANGLDVIRLEETASAPSWSPDGSRIAFAKTENGVTGIYTIASDGSDLQETLSYPRAIDSRGYRSIPSILDYISWSPDGSEILFGSSYISADGSVLHRLPGEGAYASWSPDGSRIAVGNITNGYQSNLIYPYDAAAVIYTVSPNESGGRVLVEQDANGNLSAAGGRPLSSGRVFRPRTYNDGGLAGRMPSDGLAVKTIYFGGSMSPKTGLDAQQCSNGSVVSNPSNNPLLVRDCETLLAIRDTLRANPPLNWSTSVRIEEWEGVRIGSSNESNGLAVESLLLPGYDLTGTLPPDLSSLTALRELDLSRNWLSGQIPEELGSLTDLKYLQLSANKLSGGIPPELGNLVSLGDFDESDKLYLRVTEDIRDEYVAAELDLSRNRLSGSIPLQLGNLTNLTGLLLHDNDLSGSIPPELGDLTSLKRLYLQHNDLSGSIPSELGGLTNLETLNLRHNHLVGAIPPELGNLSSLQWFSIQYNNLSGNASPDFTDIIDSLPNATLKLGGNQIEGCVSRSNPNYHVYTKAGLAHCY